MPFAWERIVRYLAKRILLYIPVIIMATVLVFLLIRVIPRDPALLILAGASGEGSFKQEDLANLRRELGTDRPIYVQYGTWLWGLLHGDLGTSLCYRTQIEKELGPRIPPTLELAFLAELPGRRHSPRCPLLGWHAVHHRTKVCGSLPMACGVPQPGRQHGRVRVQPARRCAQGGSGPEAQRRACLVLSAG